MFDTFWVGAGFWLSTIAKRYAGWVAAITSWWALDEYDEWYLVIMHTCLLVLPKCQAPTLVMIFERCGRPILQDICAKRCKPCRSGLWKCFLSKFEGVKILPSCFFVSSHKMDNLFVALWDTDHTESLWPGNLGSRKIGCLSTQSRRSHVISCRFFSLKIAAFGESRWTTNGE